MRFINHVFPFEHESMTSYLSRVAFEHDLPNLSTLLKNPVNKKKVREYNLNLLKSNSSNTEQLLDILDQLGQSPNELVLNQYFGLLFDGTPGIGKERQHFLQSRTKYCPYCIKDTPYHRIHWDLSIVTACREHQVFLVENCFNCGQVVRLSDLMKGTCRCGVQYVESTEHIEIPNNFVLEAQDTIQSLLHGEITSVENSDGQTLSNKEYFLFVDNFSTILDGMNGNGKLFLPTGLTVDEAIYRMRSSRSVGRVMNAVVSPVAHHLAISPNQESFNDVFSGLHQVSDSEAVIAYKLSCLKKVFVHPKGEYYKSFYVEYANSNPVGFSNRRRVQYSVHKQEIKPTWLTGNEAVNELGCSYVHLVNVAKKGGIPYKFSNFYGRPTMVFDRGAIDQWKRDLESMYDRHQLQDIYGISIGLLRNFLENGLLKPVHGPSIDGYFKKLFHPIEVEQFMIDIISKSLKYDHIDTEFWEPIGTCVRNLRFYKIDTADVLNLIIDGSFSSAIPNSSRTLFTDIHILKSDVQAFIEKLDIVRIKEIGFRPKEFAKVCGLSLNKVTSLIDQGKLDIKHSRHRNGTICVFIDPIEISRWKRG